MKRNFSTRSCQKSPHDGLSTISKFPESPGCLEPDNLKKLAQCQD